MYPTTGIGDLELKKGATSGPLCQNLQNKFRNIRPDVTAGTTQTSRVPDRVKCTNLRSMCHRA